MLCNQAMPPSDHHCHHHNYRHHNVILLLIQHAAEAAQGQATQRCSIITSHRKCAHVSMNEVAFYQTERTLVGSTDLSLSTYEGSVRPISVLKLTKNDVLGGDGGGGFVPAASLLFC